MAIVSYIEGFYNRKRLHQTPFKGTEAIIRI